jgi:hypothetical protein
MSLISVICEDLNGKFEVGNVIVCTVGIIGNVMVCTVGTVSFTLLFDNFIYMLFLHK